jgi:hypothetical protein
MSGGGPSSWRGRCVEEKNIVPLPEIELCFASVRERTCKPAVNKMCAQYYCVTDCRWKIVNRERKTVIY